MVCDSPNEYLDRWDGNVTAHLEDRGEIIFNVGYLFD
jgi:hypothetical protein